MQTRPDAFVVTVIQEPAKELTVGDVIVGSLGVAGVLLVLSLALGAVIGALLVWRHRRRPLGGDHLPPVSPLLPGA